MARRHPRSLLVAAGCIVLAMPVASQPADLRMGGWNVTMAMAMPGQAPRTSELKTCVTREDVDSLRMFNPEESCKLSQVQRSAQRLSAHQTCKRPDGGTSESDFEVRFDGPAAYAMSSTMRPGTGKGAGSTIKLEMTGRWAQASCKGFDD